MSSAPTTREKLDVESSQAREARLGSLLSSISSPSSDSPKGTSLPSPSNPIPSRPSAVPESDVLARARAFLPMLQASNQELLAAAAQNPDSVNIEKINGGNAIAMDLGLGVFDAPSDSKSDLGPVINCEPPAELAAQEQQNAEESEESDVTSSSDSSSDSSEDESEEEESRTSNNSDQSS
ncbi:hypothetical protein L486_00406 [Kwoniella mangroviensis CBS 10435]|uniref:Uncharacterized protein n=1 Tax=Kwoniella mangroviensis CBS 10435 TaxID=1331196 RepID=A0A1B9IZ05_9TREE|nr:uncharacterized protein I203_06274 [Kwoniella mangroviensis CBS 8507]OCF60766.1 hypothetical protein L486_00406 [Kwoniella mangroviensis CBS 10435]OCF64543.1 hypothetical protein I203_06274 [Kwoniella mangroviensis CBS 8507]OCF74486.1 hypothetical protein I204_04861 [Kwoniella mangroviensis CBS 8886]